MTAANHQAEFEELMACLDGQLTAPDADRVRAHVDRCVECQRMEAEMRDVSGRLATWTVSDAPSSLARQPERTGLAWSRWMPLAAGLVIVAGGAVMWQARNVNESALDSAISQRRYAPAPAEETTAKASPTAMALPDGRFAAQSEVAQRAAVLLVRTARLTLVPKDFDAARAGMDRIVAAAGGFVGNIVVADPRGSARSLTATLRIPSERLDETLASLKGLGQVTAESQDGEDVTQQSVDLDARLSNARASETRLKDILEKRTGRLADVLDVEREITRVRGDIERMEAERKALDRRITYAVVSIEISEERKAAVDLGPLPVSARLRNALVDGWTSAVTSALDLTVAVVRAAPVVILWGFTLGVPAAWMLRRARAATRSDARW